MSYVLSIRLDPQTRTALEAAARRQRLPKSHLAKRVLKEALSREDGFSTFLAAAGTVSGPPDASRRRKEYLRRALQSRF